MNRFVIFLLSGFGTGFLPKMPGTWGSALGTLFLSLSLLKIPHHSPEILALIWAITSLLLFVIGYFQLSLMKEIDLHKQKHSSKGCGYDQKWITLDEVVGVIVASLPAFFSSDILLFLGIGFFLFRFFDIVKPLGIRHIDNLHTPLSVFLDDVIAGVYAALVLGVIISLL